MASVKTPSTATGDPRSAQGNSANGGAVRAMRPGTLGALGLGTVLDIFSKGRLPVRADELVDQVFGPKEERGAMVISGACGVVGAGKVMQFASRLLPYGVPVIALDLPGANDGVQQQFDGLVKSFGRDTANAIMNNVIRLNYDGTSLPKELERYRPKLLLEAIPEKLELKKAHYALFRNAFPGIHIWSVTSGFPSAQLGVDIAHPSFPHQINKVFEIVEARPTPHTRLLWALGLVPMKVGDHWSFVLDVFFCGLLQATLQFCRHTNTPYWKADKYIRKLIGPNPFRAHDVIGAKGANYLTWSCLHHLGEAYGPLFTPEEALTARMRSGQAWYPPDHFRPLVNWSLDAEQEQALEAIVEGALLQMTSIVLHEQRADLPTMNAIGELCAQFSNGILARARRMGPERIAQQVGAYHRLFPAAAGTTWYPDTFMNMAEGAWTQLYVNAEHNGKAGVITISRESYNDDVDAELNRAIDWLLGQGIHRVILTGDFHLATQLVGADTLAFHPALSDEREGERISLAWSRTARRLHHDFRASVGFIHGKRCMGGMLELMMHCHQLVAVEDTLLAMPEVTIPVLPGMEGCHWPFRKADAEGRKKLLRLVLEGRPVKAADASGWLVDHAGTLENAVRTAWQVMEQDAAALKPRPFAEGPVETPDAAEAGLALVDGPLKEARAAIARCVAEACNAPVDLALTVQARHSAAFMTGSLCRKGRLGSDYDKMMKH